MGFFFKAKLARALVGSSHPNGIFSERLWGVLVALNSLRNELAHTLESKKLEAKIQRFLSSAPKPNKDSKTMQELNAALFSAIVSALSYLACFEM